jgi:hypothetical protein
MWNDVLYAALLSASRRLLPAAASAHFIAGVRSNEFFVSLSIVLLALTTLAQAYGQEIAGCACPAACASLHSIFDWERRSVCCPSCRLLPAAALAPTVANICSNRSAVLL